MIFSSKHALNMLAVSYPSNNLNPANGQCKYCVTKLLQQISRHSCRSLSRYDSHTHTDYYAILGVSKSATADEIKAAFVKQSKKLHPDKNPSIKSHSQFVNLNDAYTTLKSPDLRRTYDLKMGFRMGEGGGVYPHDFHNRNSSGPLYYEFYNPHTGQTEWTTYRNPNVYNDAAWRSHVNRHQREENFRQNFNRRSSRQWGGFSVDEDIDRGGKSDFNRHIVSTYLTMFLLLFLLTIGGSSYATRSNKYRKLDYDRLMLLETQNRYVDIDMRQAAKRKARSNSDVSSTNVDSETR